MCTCTTLALATNSNYHRSFLRRALTLMDEREAEEVYEAIRERLLTAAAAHASSIETENVWALLLFGALFLLVVCSIVICSGQFRSSSLRPPPPRPRPR